MKYAAWCIGLFAAILARAAEVQDPIGDALRGIDPAGSSCRREPITAGSSTSAPQGGAADLSCAISAVELQSLRTASQIHIVDTRTVAEYAQLHIDAALNLSWGDTRARSHLKARPIVLLGSGKDDQSLYVGCAELKAAGAANVRVLRGGMASWIEAGLPIVGAPPDKASLKTLADEQFMEALEFPANLIFAMPEAKDFTSLTPRAMLLGQRTGAAVRSRLNERARQVGDEKFASIVLLTAKAPTGTEMDQLATAVQPHPVLFYVGSAADYAAFVKTKRAVWTAQARGPKSLPCSSR